MQRRWLALVLVLLAFGATACPNRPHFRHVRTTPTTTTTTPLPVFDVQAGFEMCREAIESEGYGTVLSDTYEVGHGEGGSDVVLLTIPVDNADYPIAYCELYVYDDGLVLAGVTN